MKRFIYIVLLFGIIGLMVVVWNAEASSTVFVNTAEAEGWYNFQTPNQEFLGDVDGLGQFQSINFKDSGTITNFYAFLTAVNTQTTKLYVYYCDTDLIHDPGQLLSVSEEIRIYTGNAWYNYRLENPISISEEQCITFAIKNSTDNYPVQFDWATTQSIQEFDTRAYWNNYGKLTDFAGTMSYAYKLQGDVIKENYSTIMNPTQDIGYGIMFFFGMIAFVIAFLELRQRKGGE